MAHLLVLNSGSEQIDICVCKWKDDNDSKWHTLSVNGSKDDHKDYDRNDERGFLMVVRRYATSDPGESRYAIRDRGRVVISDSEATQDGVTLEVIELPTSPTE